MQLAYRYIEQKEGISRRERAKILHDEAYKLLYQTIRQYYPIDPDTLVLLKEENGKPYFKDNPFYFNVSHCDTMVACILDEVPVGIDIEEIRAFNPKVVKKAFTDKESNFIKNEGSPEEMFFKIWTLKECHVKATGEGMRTPFSKLDFNFDDDTITCSQKGYHYYQMLCEEKGSRYVLSAAVQGEKYDY